MRKLEIITTSPLTRIEGRAKFEIILGRDGSPRVNFVIEDYRRFEEFLKGKMAVDIPRIVPRVCGMCPVSHALAACKTVENALNISITSTAESLRRLMLLSEIAKSHIVHIFYMMLPDLETIDPQTRKELAFNALKLIKMYDEIIATISGRNIHPMNCIVGGISKPLDHENRQILERKARNNLQIAYWMKNELSAIESEDEEFNESEIVYMGLQKAGAVNFYDGAIKAANKDENIDETFSAKDYERYLVANANNNFTFKGNKRLLVGPVARSYIGSLTSGNKTRIEPKDFAVVATQHRLNEIADCLTEAQILLNTAELSSPDVRIPIEIPDGRGIGAVEAPRGILIHDFEFRKGYVEKARFLVPTSFNLDSIGFLTNTILRKLYGNHDTSSVERRLKRALRSFDPCISCLDA